MVWALALVNLLLVTGLAAAAVTAQAVARQRVAAAADVAALVAAQSEGNPCTQAADSARANGMELTACTTLGPDVVVSVAAAAPGVVVRLLGLLGRVASPVTASARAGPPAD
jgi:secretion/DNA translocation related TadE-like protein